MGARVWNNAGNYDANVALVQKFYAWTRCTNEENFQTSTLGSVEIQDSQIRKSVIQAPKGVWHAPIRFDRRPVGEDGAALFR
jgi:hypothetical protein